MAKGKCDVVGVGCVGGLLLALPFWLALGILGYVWGTASNTYQNLFDDGQWCNMVQK